ncbi:Scarecrow-like transcription factor pat1 [Thalictrum thalictroides]|uniref:Scarecrow-like transcription factor pat1 n=1 Tax=Thalictrum thalictroides TaxID=46969 RepID=A0A7J6VYX0_THATH|nr:Scarecrow-like transcription factor pat1 [Thalictrum thalictroides]
MASGFPSSGIGSSSSSSSGGGDFYINNPTTSFGGGSAMINHNVQLHQYRQQQLQHLQNLQSEQISSIPFRRNMSNFVGKRSISEQQQQQGVLYRSVKQRNHYNHTSPISPLTPFDFSSSLTGNNNYHTSYSSSSSSHPHLQQQLRSLSSNNSSYNINPSFSNNSSSSSSFVSNQVVSLDKEFESEKKMRNRLEELEKQLLDDNEDDDVEGVIGRDVVVSGVTSSEWSETIQNLITPNHQISNKKPPFSPSPTSSSSSSSASSSSPQTFSSKQSFIDIATAISDGNLDIASTKLDHLSQVSNFHGDSEQRFIAYMVSALRARLNPTQNLSNGSELFQNDHIMATQTLYEASPCFKLCFMAANLAIIEATRDQPNNIHIVDFDICQGKQYISLIQAIGERQQSKTATGIRTKPITMRITSVLHPHPEENQNQRIVGDRLKKLADLVGIGFKFNMVICKTGISSLNQESFSCEKDEALVVNFAFKLYKLSDESVSTENPRDELLRLVKSLNPRVVTMVEQEMNCNTAPFVARVAEVSSYYLALFNSIDSTLNRDGSERVKIEEALGRKAINSVTCEGKERVERCELFGKWRARMRMAGFVTRQLGQHVAESMKAKLNSVYRNNPGFTVKEEADGICFGWNDRVLTVASAWC